ncbi:hypothetical protein INT45_010313 [Circinella minor]|uniref:Uncharacterized protein n=1 Tax=Circinella minor TaxID=1195481 RepID=A0A8H7VJU3_9FUNG|nr:hypothetical protein INT45_010313 [Circinella minor]
MDNLYWIKNSAPLKACQERIGFHDKHRHQELKCSTLTRNVLPSTSNKRERENHGDDKDDDKEDTSKKAKLHHYGTLGMNMPKGILMMIQETFTSQNYMEFVGVVRK